jgi:hypothetical protein
METKDIILLLAGFPLSLAASGAWQFISLRMPRVSGWHSTAIGGFWLGRANYSTTEPNRYGFNLYRINEVNGRVVVYIEHADNFVEKIRIVRGVGVFRPPSFSLFYYYKDNSHESGVATFILLSTHHGEQIFSGSFSQIKDIIGNYHIFYSDYTLVRVDLPVWQRFRRIQCRRYFRDFEDMSNFVEALPNPVKAYLTCQHRALRKDLGEPL